MNPQTGKVYQGAQEIDAARARGEGLVAVSDHVAGLLREGRASRTRRLRRLRRRRDEIARESRRRNRR